MYRSLALAGAVCIALTLSSGCATEDPTPPLDLLESDPPHPADDEPPPGGASDAPAPIASAAGSAQSEETPAPAETGSAGTLPAPEQEPAAGGSTGSPPAPASPAETPQSPAPARDRFGVAHLYPTVAGGREWHLSGDPQGDPEWRPGGTVAKVAPGVFRIAGQVRMSVVSPPGKAWWRDVEMTGYFRRAGDATANGQSPHWELFARGERHSASGVAASEINGGVRAPSGTATWPGYPFGTGAVNPRCLGSSYHGNVYTTGRVLFEKELTHTEGYAAQKAQKTIAGFAPSDSWFGVKLVLRNADGGARVHLELWLDRDASGRFEKVTEHDDVAGGWPARSATLDGCTAAPFGYEPGQLITWAGPWATFRSDAMATEFKWLSVREIGPIQP